MVKIRRLRRLPSKREWQWRDAIGLLAAFVVSFVVIWYVALLKSPLNGGHIVMTLQIVGLVMLSLTLGSLGFGDVYELVNRGAGRHNKFGKFDFAVMVVITFCTATADAFLLYMLMESTMGWVFWRWVVLAGASTAAGVAVAWLGLWPQRTAGDASPWSFFFLLSTMLGTSLGAAVPIGALGVSAYWQNRQASSTDLSGALLPIPDVHGMYVALGDSYSAGEGNPPFPPISWATNCDQSLTWAYPRFLKFDDPRVRLSFRACSGAITQDIFSSTVRNGHVVGPQVGSQVQTDVGLVTITIGGNDLYFSKVLQDCITDAACLTDTFSPPTRPGEPGPDVLDRWGPAAIAVQGRLDVALFGSLRNRFPDARIVVIGYPWLFPTTRDPSFFPLACFTLLNRVSWQVRDWVRSLQVQFDDETYEAAVASHVEFVSSEAMWQGHEPCGVAGQYTNEIKPYIISGSLWFGGSFHPSHAGQWTLARLVACYLNEYTAAPDPYAGPAHHPVVLPADRLEPPAYFGLVAPPGQARILPRC